jgi:hypothetical protein
LSINVNNEMLLFSIFLLVNLWLFKLKQNIFLKTDNLILWFIIITFGVIGGISFLNKHNLIFVFDIISYIIKI